MMDRKKYVSEVLRKLGNAYPNTKCALNFTTPLELLIAVILSAQCTDERVNIVTKNLFKKYKTPSDYANESLEKFQSEIKSINFYKNKAKNIISACGRIISQYDGKVPKNMNDLITLDGVARKTANVVMYHGFGIVEGVVVDTHVLRLSLRLGLTKNKTPEKVEKDLMDILPKSQWGGFSDFIIRHGRKICKARTPLCQECFLSDICPSCEKYAGR